MKDTLRPYLADLNIADELSSEAYIDAGDVLFCSDRVLVGQSSRTNLGGFQALQRTLQTIKPNLQVDCVPFSGVLHLKTGLTELAPGILLRDPKFKTNYSFGWCQCITLPEEEGYSAHVMPINDQIVIPKGFPTVQEIAKKYYSKVIELNMSEFQKMDGGLSCLSLRY